MGTARTLVLTGATGFIGTRVAKLAVEKRVKVQALVRPTSNVTSLSDMGIPVNRVDLDGGMPRLSLPKGSVIVHMGGPGLSDLVARREEAREGISSLLEACTDAQVSKFVYLSSIKARPPVLRAMSNREYAPDVYAKKKSRRRKPPDEYENGFTLGHPSRACSFRISRH